ncbi:hypothetical protein GCM10009825_22750 [Arthrobacter humicola]|uniref:MarR family transcriptional regulator n=1 Tax=Arthrobacter humicola TaxID=409291 RepID=A0ABP5KTB2_9MICC
MSRRELSGGEDQIAEESADSFVGWRPVKIVRKTLQGMFSEPWIRFAAIGGAVIEALDVRHPGNPPTLHVLWQLSTGPKTVTELAEASGAPR